MEEKQRKSLIILCAVLGVILALMIGCTLLHLSLCPTGFVEEDGFTTYRDSRGRRVSGWVEVDGQAYYFGADYAMITGWRRLDGNQYYFAPDGAMVVGWADVDGQRYYFGENGILRTGWLTLQGNRYYLRDDGTMASGFQKIGEDTFCFSEDGVLLTGWQVRNEKTYHFSDSGVMTTGRVTMDGNRYYFQENGVMFTGWEETDDGRRYYAMDGALASGWTELEGSWYLFSDDGIAQQGWYQEDEYRYYFLDDGAAAVGPQKIDGQQYFFTPKGIMVVLVNADHAVPSYYKPELVTFEGWHEVADIALEPLKKMLADCVAAGYPYVFNSAYRSRKVQEDILYARTQEHIDAGLSPGDAYAEARKTVALPGTSEHHLGLAMDILNDKKAENKALEWLGAHCWEYGFILRYAEDKSDITGIVYEPWHFRYVGTAVSMDMKDSGLCLEEYLGAGPVSNSTV